MPSWPRATLPAAPPAPGAPPAGLSLLELLVTLAIAALLGSLAYPSYQSALHKVRRADALAWLAQLQLAQTRHRSQHPVYATLAQLGLADRSPGGHYALSEQQPPSAGGYRVLASAQGSQAADASCRHLLLQVEGPQTHQASGPTASADNPAAVNQRCWGH